MDDALKEKLRELADAKVPIRQMSKVLDGARGSSRSNAARFLEEDAEEALALLNERRFDDVPIVAAQFDGTWIGTRNEKRLVLIAIGVTAEGQRVALDARIAKSENQEEILAMLRGIVDRGVSPGILWTSDRGEGFRAALTALTHPNPPLLQLCTTHVAGNVVSHLEDEEEKKRVRKELYEAWWEDDPDVVLARLSSIAGDLEEKGHPAAASSLRGAMAGTVTVQRLGLVRSLRRQLRSTNRQEGTNGQVKGSGLIAYVTRWKDDPMLLEKVAWNLLRLERNSWNRMPEAEQLVDLMEQLIPGRFDAEAFREGLPPTMSVERLPVRFGDDERMRDFAARWCAEHPDAVTIGSAATLDALGLQGKAVTPEVLVDAMRCLPPGAEKSLRRASQITIEGFDDDGNPTEQKASGILNLEWELIASPAAMREWQEGGAAREEVEARMMAAASAAVARVTMTAESNRGFAAVAALHRPALEGPEQRLRVSGITFAVQRGRDAMLESPATRGIRASENVRAAEDEAKAVLQQGSREPAAPDAGTEPALPADDRLDSAPAGPELVAAVKARALELGPRMVGKKDEELGAYAARMEEVFEGLDLVEGEVRRWRKTNWDAAARQIAAAGGRASTGSPPRKGAWSAITRGQRAVLGDVYARSLLERAVYRFGRAQSDPEEARELGQASEDALAGLKTPIGRVEAAAEALAAGREVLRRIELEAVRGSDGRASPEPPLRDSRGVLAADPIDRHRAALGDDRWMALKRFAHSLAPEMRDLDDGALRLLIAEHASTWEMVDPTLGKRLAALEGERDSALSKRLKAVRAVGEATGARQKATRERDGNAFFAADKDVEAAIAAALGHREELYAAEEKVAELRGKHGSPALLIEDHPEAAIHHAAFAELAQRERMQERARPAVEADLGAGVG